jgi:hypothetical protein
VDGGVEVVMSNEVAGTTMTGTAGLAAASGLLEAAIASDSSTFACLPLRAPTFGVGVSAGALGSLPGCTGLPAGGSVLPPAGTSVGSASVSRVAKVAGCSLPAGSAVAAIPGFGPLAGVIETAVAVAERSGVMSGLIQGSCQDHDLAFER